MASTNALIDMEAANARKLPVIMEDPWSVTCDYSPSTHMLIGRRQPDLMKPRQHDPARADPRLAGEADRRRGLDVYWNQLPVTHDPCVPEERCKLDNLIPSPHNGGRTGDTRSRKARRSITHGCNDQGERPAALRNPEIYATA
jgi:hypothetical protein